MSRQLSPDKRAAAAIAAMTPDERMGLLLGSLPLLQKKTERQTVVMSPGYIPGVPRLGIPAVAETDASLGVANLAHMRKNDVATALPSALALGASWSPELARQGGQVIGAEARAKGFGVLLAGGVNLVRDPRAGRNFEYVSEDPLLTGMIGGQAIAGVQSNAIVSTIKHFALNDQETGRTVYSVDMPEAAMRESDLLAFELAIAEGRPGSVMCAYNRVNTIYACENSFLLNKVLRDDWGFKGFVMSDWGAVHSTGSLAAGLDQQSGHQLDRKPWLGAELKAAIAAGTARQADVDRAAARLLRTFFASGVYDDPPQPGRTIDYDAHARVAQAQAEAGIVLLKNDGGLLPLAATAKRIAVIGGHADKGVLSGGGSTQVIPVGGATLEVAQKGPGLTSFLRRTYGGVAPLAAIRRAFPGARVDYLDGSDRAAAASLAATADVAIVFGEKWFYESADSFTYALDEGQDDLIAAVAAANRRTVVVLETGNPVAMPWEAQVPAIVAAWYPGQQGGEAIARVLSGAVNPMGHLPVTWPESLTQLPQAELPGEKVPEPAVPIVNMGQKQDKVPFAFSYREGSDVGYRWFARTATKPRYPFGYGLSYTSFVYGRPAVSGGGSLKVRFSVTNSGKVAGTDVAQVYVTPPGGTKRLVGWGRATLKPGQGRSFEVTADPRVIGSFDERAQAWIVRAGTYRVELARSAEDAVHEADVRMKAARLPVAGFRMTK